MLNDATASLQKLIDKINRLTTLKEQKVQVNCFSFDLIRLNGENLDECYQFGFLQVQISQKVFTNMTGILSGIASQPFG